jgi:hypothetical protein
MRINNRIGIYIRKFHKKEETSKLGIFNWNYEIWEDYKDKNSNIKRGTIYSFGFWFFYIAIEVDSI